VHSSDIRCSMISSMHRLTFFKNLRSFFVFLEVLLLPDLELLMYLLLPEGDEVGVSESVSTSRISESVSTSGTPGSICLASGVSRTIFSSSVSTSAV